MMAKQVWMMVAALVAGVLFGAPAPAVKNHFPRPPAAAVTALNKTVGKPFSAGYVFIDGHYVKPPYTVERYGTVIRINGLQVTREIVPWEEFVKTQEGVTVTRTEIPPAGGDAANAVAEPEPEPEPEVEEVEDDAASSLDDLFDDDPKPKKTVAKKPVKRRTAARPRPRKPTTVVSYSLEGPFTPNERSNALLAKVNARRTMIDSQLRAGGTFFFSSRYSNVSGDIGTTRLVIEKLPDVMKNGSTREAFGQKCRQAGLTFITPTLMDDLFKNRFDYLQLNERRKADQQKTQWQNLLGE